MDYSFFVMFVDYVCKKIYKIIIKIKKTDKQIMFYLASTLLFGEKSDYTFSIFFVKKNEIIIIITIINIVLNNKL